MEYTKKEIKDLFAGEHVSPILPYESLDGDKRMMEAIIEGNGHISLSGVQPKFSMVTENGKLRLARKDERGTYILKPAPTAMFILDREFCPYNEYLTMQLANHIYGIDTAKCALCYFQNGKAAYITRRFDISPDGGKYAQEDFASLAGLNKDKSGSDYKYDILSYEDCADIIHNYVRADVVEVLKFFRLVLFNYITLNDDAHLKNFSLIERKDKDYVLSPAYDLMNTSLHFSQSGIFALRKGLFKEGTLIDDTHSITRASFKEFGLRIGLNERAVERELDRFAREYPKVGEMIMSSGLPENLAGVYLSSYNYRRFTIQ